MNTKHTPGPWRWRTTAEGKRFLRGSSEVPIAVLITRDSRPKEANARLIAAAPDMLAALKTIASPASIVDADDDDIACGDTTVSIVLTIEEFNAIRAAIAKAEGAPTP